MKLPILKLTLAMDKDIPDKPEQPKAICFVNFNNVQFFLPVVKNGRDRTRIYYNAQETIAVKETPTEIMSALWAV